jgi:dephospho-CoA kinase
LKRIEETEKEKTNVIDMEDSYIKYIKYKKKYLRTRLMQLGGAANIILLDGTSSSGKTTISELYKQQGYEHIQFDDYHQKGRISVLKTLPNEYISQDALKKITLHEIHRLMFEESKKYDKVIFDDIVQDILDFFDRKKVYVIVVYTSLNDLINNMIARKSTSPRGLFVFSQYAKRYVKLDSEKGSLDTINRKNFIENLKQLKSEFESESKLIEFATKIFSDMGIYDDYDYNIGLRETYQADYIVNTHGKSPDKIYEEIKVKTDEYNE